MKDRYKIFRDLLKNMLVHLGMESSCILKETGDIADINQTYSKIDFLIDLHDSNCFIFKGDFSYCVEKLLYLVQNSDFSFGSFTHDKHQYILQTLEQMLNAVREQEMVRFWTMKISKEFVELYEEYNLRNVLNFDQNEFKILELESNSWISQIKNLLCCRKSSGKRCLLDEKIFWYQFGENLSILEYFFNSNQFKFMYRAVLEHNMLIAKTTFDTVQNIKRYQVLSKTFNVYYEQLDLDSLYQSNNVKSYEIILCDIVKIIENSFIKQPNAIQNSLKNNFEGLLARTLVVLKDGCLENDYFQIRSIITTIYKLYNLLFTQKPSESLTHEENLKNHLSALSNYSSLCTEFENSVHSMRIVNLLTNLTHDKNENIKILEVKTKEYKRYIEEKYRTLNIDEVFQDFVKFDELCVNFVTACFKDIWLNKTLLVVSTNNEQERFNNNYSNNLNVRFVHTLTSSTSINDMELNLFLEILKVFSYFLKFNSFLQDTVVERTSLLDHFNRQLICFSNSLNYDDSNLTREIGLYLGFSNKLEIVLTSIFNPTEKLVIIDTLRQKMKMVEENIHLRLNLMFEVSYNYFIKRNLLEHKLLTIRESCVNLLDSLKLIDLIEEFDKIEHYFKMLNILKCFPKSKVGENFVNSIRSSHFFVLLMQELNPYFEFKTTYFRFVRSLKIFKEVLSSHPNRFDLFKEEIDDVFKEIKKVFNLKIKYLLVAGKGLEDSVVSLKNKYDEFVILTTRLNLQKNFRGSFTFNAEDHCFGFGQPNTFFFRSCFEASYDILVSNYFQDVIDRIHNKQVYKEIEVVEDQIPELSIVFNLFDDIFPSQKGLSFFDVVSNFVKVDCLIKRKIENVIDIVLENYNELLGLFNFLLSHVEEKRLSDKIQIYKDKIQFINNINGNIYPLYKFTSVLSPKKYEKEVENLLEQLNMKRENSIKKLLKNTKRFYRKYNLPKDAHRTIEDPFFCGVFLDFHLNTFQRAFRKIKKNQIENLNDLGLVEVEELHLELDKIFKNIQKHREDILKTLEIEKENIFEKLGSLEKMNDVKKDIMSIEESISCLDHVLLSFNKPSIDQSVLINFKQSLNERETIQEIRNEWETYTGKPMNILNLQGLMDFIARIKAQNLDNCKELHDIINKSDLIQSIPLLFKEFVTEDYFNRNIILEDFFLTFSVDKIKEIVYESEMCYKASKAIKRIKEAIHEISFSFDKVIINFEDVENELFDILAECSAVENYIKIDKVLKEVKEITELVYSMIRINTKIKEIQDVNLDLTRIMDSNVFKSKKDKFVELNKEIRILIEVSGEKHKEKTRCPLRNLLNKEQSIETLRLCAIELQLHVKNTITSYREQVYRFYFVSDEDILSLLCEKTTYSELLLQMYNIDEVICKNNNAIGFKSNGEIVILSNPVSLSLDVFGFFIDFASSLKETLTFYLKKKISNIKSLTSCDPVILENITQYCGDKEIESKNNQISVIDDFLNDFFYFNNLPYENSTKINFLKATNEQWNGGVNLLYPKPRITNGEFIIEEISTNNIYMEYYPPSDMVFTKLTSSIFSLISLGLAKTAGVILFGKSGTGKTETVKYYCRTILRPVYVFCCSEECDILTLENIIVGCIKMGAYLCLDEFNRLKKHTMSGVTELIFKNKDEVKFFLTMNLGYSGRNELPKSLQSIFTDVRVDNPDIDDIVNIFFGDLSNDIIQFLKALEAQCEKHEHYNFGLRAIKTVMETTLDPKEFRKLFGLEIFSEKTVLYAFYIFYHSTLSNVDKIILNQIFFDIFKIRITNKISYEDTFNFGISASAGLLVYGKTRSGKSSLIRKLAVENNVQMEYYNPPNTQNFFGAYDEITGEWMDGEFITSIKQNKEKEVWYVFDCTLSSNWIENFNSALDDNRSLCLKSGEIIKIGSKIRFIFEGDDLENITPATLTRMFTIYIENEETVDEFRAEEGTTLSQKILKENRVILMKGSGKFEVVSSLIKKDLLAIVDACDKKSDTFFDIFKKNDLIIRNNKKLYFNDTVVYIERVERASRKLKEFIREYAQYNKIGDIHPSKLRIICSFDENKIDKRIMAKAILINCRNMDLSSKIHQFVTEEKDIVQLFELLKSLKQLEHFTSTILNIYQEKLLKYHDIFKLCRILSLALPFNSNESFCDVFYFITTMFSKDDTKDIFRTIWECEPHILSFNSENGFTKTSEQCVKSIISLILTLRQPLIIVGPKMSSKRFLLDNCADKVYSDIKIYNFYDELDYDPSGVYLVDTSEKVSKLLLRKSIVVHLDIPLLICFDYTAFYSSCATVKSKTKADEFILYGFYERKSLDKYSCGFNIPKSNRIYSVKDGCNEEYFKNEVRKRLPQCEIINFNDVFFQKEHKEKMCLIFDSMFKYRDFVETALKLYESSVEKHERRKLHVEEGYKRIGQFKEQAAELLSVSLKKKNQLEQLQAQIKIKMDKMVEIQILMKVEKERIYRNQNELDVVFKESMEKKGLIDLKMKDIIPLIEKSKSKISSISKKHLAEIKTMVKPPEIIKFVIELVYTMLEDEPDVNISWSSLIQYVRKEDFMSKVMNFKGIEDTSSLERILQGRTMESAKAYKASQACGILYDWIIANYEYKKVYVEVKPLLDETQEIDLKIEDIKRRIEEEETKYKTLEDEINGNKQEYAKLKDSLEDLKEETQAIEDKQNKLNTTLKVVHSETDKWDILPPEDPLVFMRNNSDWHFTEKKNLFISKNQDIEKEIEGLNLKGRSFLKTSVKHKNFKQLLRNVQEFNSDVLIFDVDEFVSDIYRLLKYQMKVKSFSVVLISNFNKNFYSACTYRYEVHGRLSIDEEINIEKYEQNLMNAIVDYKELDDIIQARDMLDNKRKEYSNLKSIRDHLSELNKLYSSLDFKYKQAYGFGLSFNIFKEFVERNKFDREVNASSLTFKRNKFDKEVNASSLTFKDIEDYFNLGLPTNTFSFDIKEEFNNCRNDLTIISGSEDIIYEVERKITLADTISAGSVKNNSKIIQLFKEDSEATYLIKNVNLLERDVTRLMDKKTRFIFVSEGDTNHNLIYNTRILFNPKEIELGKMKEKYLKIFKDEEEAIDYHCKQMQVKNVSFKELFLVVTSKDVCDEEYLKYLVYETK